MSNSSKHWKTMNIVQKEEKNDGAIISTNPSPEAKIDIDYTIKYGYNKGIIQFLKNNNITDSGNVPMSDEKWLENCTDDVFCLCRIEKKDKIYGFCLSLILPISVQKITRNMIKYTDTSLDIYHSNKKTVHFGYTNYLCSDIKEREKDFGINSVKATLQYGYPKGVQFGYYVNTEQRSRHGIQIYPWYRILNYKHATKAGFKTLKTSDEVLNNELYFKPTMPVGYKTQLCDENDWKTHNKFNSDKLLAFTPNKDYWKIYCKHFETYKVIYENVIVGIYSIYIHNVYMKKSDITCRCSTLIFLCGIETHIPNILQCSTNNCGNSDVVYGYAIGDVKIEHLQKLKAYLVKPMWLEWYNTGVKYKTTEIHVPIY
jgi:hypothetical protein